MGHKVHIVVFTSLIILMVLNGSEGKRKKPPKPVGKCLDRYGNLKCNSKQVCVATRNTLCVPYDMSRKCRCKKNKVRGCEDSVGRSVCKNDEKCVQKKSGKSCKNSKSRTCKCAPSSVAPTPDKGGKGPVCKAEAYSKTVWVPADSGLHAYGSNGCLMCMCRFIFPSTIESYCFEKTGCKPGMQLFAKG